MGEAVQSSGGGDKATAERKFLFTACFVALVATSFAFVMRAFLAADWQIDFGLSETQKGEIMGAGLWPFGLSIVLFSLIIDKVGYGKSMIFAFACHVVSVVLFFTAWGYWPLYFGSLLCGLAAGTIEAVINPAIASVYPKQKIKMLSILHAGWAGGIALNGVMVLLIGKQGLDVHWRFLTFLLLIPVAAYGVMLLKAKFPVSERVAAGIPYKDMLKEAGALSCLIVVYMVLVEIDRVVGGFGMKQVLDTTFFDLPSPIFTALIFIATGAYFWYTRSLGQWMYVFLLFVMILLAITELGTDNWIKELMSPAMAKMGMSGGWLLVYTATIMMVLRFLVGHIQKGLSKVSPVLGTPLGILLLSAILAATGIYFLAWAEGAWILLFATIYGMGQCFFWPVTIGLASERFPRGGALTINAIAGVGMLGVGILGSQLLGFWQDTRIDDALMARDKQAHVRLMSPEEKKSIFGTYKSLNQAKVNEVNDKTALYDYRAGAKDKTKLAEDGQYQVLVRNAYNHLVRQQGDAKVYSHDEMDKALAAGGIYVDEATYGDLSKDKALVGEMTTQAKKSAMSRCAILPVVMALCYLGLIFYFRSKGGYKRIDLVEGEGAKASKAEATA